MQIPLIMRVIGLAQNILHRARTIHDARQTAGQDVECYPNRRDEKNGGERNLNEVGDVDRLDRRGGHAADARSENTPAAVERSGCYTNKLTWLSQERQPLSSSSCCASWRSSAHPSKGRRRRGHRQPSAQRPSACRQPS